MDNYYNDFYNDNTNSLYVSDNSATYKSTIENKEKTRMANKLIKAIKYCINKFNFYSYFLKLNQL